MPKPGTCSLRECSPLGPMFGCEDLGCYQLCVKLIKHEKEREPI